MFVRKDNELSPIEEKIVKIIKSEEGKPIFQSAIINKIGNSQKKVIFSAIDYLLNEGIIIKIPSGKLVMGYINGPILKGKSFLGTITISSKGDAFFKKKDEEKSSIYINKINLNNALDGDLVRVCLMEKDNTYDDLLDGVVLEVVERSKDFFVGTYFSNNEKGKKKYTINPENSKIKYEICIDDESQLFNGCKALFKISNIKNGKIYCGLSKILGHIDDVGSDIISIVYDNGIEPNFDDEVKEEVKNIDFGFSKIEDEKRKDLSHLNFVTIDPLTSKDMDDAIYVEKYGDKFKLFVAIADVSYYVNLKSKLWNSVLERGTSIYLVNQVIPMIPHKLSNNICSLNPNEKRYSIVCEMVIDNNGFYTSIDVYPAIIISKKKFAYDDINNYFLKQEKLSDVSDDIYKMIDFARMLHNILDERHKKEGYIDFEIPEPKIELDSNQKILNILVKKSGEAQKMIENFMVAANEAVTIKFEELNPGIPFVYRVHNKPDEKKIELFKTEAKKIGFKFDESLKEWESDTVSKWLILNKDNNNKELINMILLRTMAKAKYDSNNIGHFGLSLKKYTHFTSPIRRLSDVIVHHLYRAFVFDKDRYTEDQRRYLINNIDDFNQKANKTEVNAVTTEREVNSMKFAEYMETQIGKEFIGFVSFIVSFGIFVQLDNTIEGLVKPATLKDDFYIFDEHNITYVGKKNKRIISLGDKVKIKVISSSKEMRKIDFEIIEFLSKNQ